MPLAFIIGGTGQIGRAVAGSLAGGRMDGARGVPHAPGRPRTVRTRAARPRPARRADRRARGRSGPPPRLPVDGRGRCGSPPVGAGPGRRAGRGVERQRLPRQERPHPGRGGRVRLSSVPRADPRGPSDRRAGAGDVLHTEGRNGAAAHGGRAGPRDGPAALRDPRPPTADTRGSGGSSSACSTDDGSSPWPMAAGAGSRPRPLWPSPRRSGRRRRARPPASSTSPTRTRPTVAEIGRTVMAVMVRDAELVGLPDEAYPPTRGATPWSTAAPMVCASSLPAGGDVCRDRTARDPLAGGGHARARLARGSAPNSRHIPRSTSTTRWTTE